MTAAELQEKVLDGSYPEMTWIIAATVTWSPACIALESMFARSAPVFFFQVNFLPRQDPTIRLFPHAADCR